MVELHVISQGSERVPGALEDHLQRLMVPAREALNTWLSKRHGVRLLVGAMEFSADWIDPPSELAFGLEFVIGAHRFLVALDSLAAIDELLVGKPFQRLPVVLRDLVVQRFVGAFVDALPGELCAATDVQTIFWNNDSIPRWDCALGVRLECVSRGAVSRGICAAESPDALLWLHERLPPSRVAATRLPPNVPVDLFVGLGHTRLDVKLIDGLMPGDVVWAETARLSADGVVAALLGPDGAHAWECRIKRNRIRVKSLLDQGQWDVAVFVWPRSSKVRSHAVAQSIDSTIERGETSMPVPRASLELPVTFDLGEITMPLGDVEGVEAGTVIDLPQDISNATVNMRVSGVLIAEGRLIAVGRRLGVCLTRVVEESSQG